ncbi:MAG: DUF167 domain-containing protein [Promethearchaeota archaeon]
MPHVDVALRVKPNAKESRMSVDGDGFLLVSVKAPPAKGKANRELIKVLSKLFGTSSGNIEIIAGSTTRDKKIRLHGIDDVSYERALEALQRGAR